MAWTGGSNPRLIIWGGVDNGAVPQNTGGLYDMVTDTWESSQLSGAPKQRQRHSAVWTGQKMIIYGGYGGDDEYFGDAWEYTPPVQ
ncbi:MAG: hypothetical protein HY762_01170 [Planctomycetes bacterium]|nr:hypothetical protein [Planctomycetota bacterium]